MMRSKRALFLIATGVLAILFPGGDLSAQRNLTNIPDPSPEAQRRTFQVADGFAVNLYASDPLVTKPIQIAFDERGRLWVASSGVYPQIRPGQAENDRVLILEDLDRDGDADRVTEFAKGLLMPTGVLPGDGGAYVALGGELVHFSDRDDDGVSDERRVVLSGFGLEDTHHVFHSLRWGPDGKMYFNQSYYIQSHIETPYGPRRLDGGGVWQYDTVTGRLEVFVRGMVNSWGHRWDRFGQSFCTDGAFGEGINYVFPGSTFVASPGTVRKLRGLNPGNPKHAGLEQLTGDHFPPAWRDRWITADFRANRIDSFTVTEGASGSGYAGRKRENLLTSTHIAFRSVDMTMGPDGAIYFADWYNPIIQHGEVNFKDERRDHVHGRIWRVAVADRPALEYPKLSGAPLASLLRELRSSHEWTRRQARRLIREHPSTETIGEAKSWFGDVEKAFGHGDFAASVEQSRLELLWIHQSRDVVDHELLRTTLRSTEPRVRAAAIRVLADPEWRRDLDDAESLLATAILDEYPRVRLEAVLALAEIDTTQAAEIALRALDSPGDRWLDYAIWHTVRRLGPRWVPSLEAGDVSFASEPRHLEFALQSVDSPAVVDPLFRVLAREDLAPERASNVARLIASLADADQLGRLFDIAIEKDSRHAHATLRALELAAERRRPKPSGDLARVSRLLSVDTSNTKAATAARLAGHWGLIDLRPQLIELARTKATSAPLRESIFHALARLDGFKSHEVLIEFSTDQHDLTTRVDAVRALTRLDPADAAPLAASLLRSITVAAEIERLIETFIERRGAPDDLASALEDQTIGLDTAKIAVRTARSSAIDHSVLITALQKAGGLESKAWSFQGDELAKFLSEIRDSGDAAHGERVFRREELRCMSCHAIAGAGGRVGPDFSSLGASAPADYLLESLITPNAQIKENYPSLVVALRDGRVLTGIRVAQSREELTLRLAVDTDLAIPVASILQQSSGGSLMPAGLVSDLTRAELRDLVKFLTLLGKTGSGYAIDSRRVVRRWELLQAPRTIGASVRVSKTLPASIATSEEWTSVFSTVGGSLPSRELSRDGTTPIIRFRIDVSAAGPLRLMVGVNSTRPSAVFVDSKRISIDGTVELAKGIHTITLVLEEGTTAKSLSIELLDVSGASTQASIVTGN